MKKIKILMLMVVVLLLIGCGVKKETIDDEDFNRIMSGEGFSIVDVEQQFADYGYFEDAYVAIESNGNYQIEFYELEEDNYAQSFYETNKKIFEQSETDTSIRTNLDLTTNNKYTLTTDTEYKVLSRIEDTVIYLNVKKVYKDEVNDILKKLGY